MSPHLGIIQTKISSQFSKAFGIQVYLMRVFSYFCPLWIIGRASLATLQNKVRLKVLPEQFTLFVNTSVTLKNASFNSFLCYHPDYCSEIHALSYSSNKKYR